MYICKKNINIIVFNNIPDYLNIKLTQDSLQAFVSDYGYSIDKLSYNFITKDAMLALNIKHLNHSTHTDIISFDYSSKRTLRAEFFISPWAVSRSADEYSQNVVNEMLRVVSHGVLHCLGFKDKSDNDKSLMRREENKFINMFHVKPTFHV
ncbi:rRNA maturation RNase YbeY [Flavobacteriaceae bacterium]|nr:rRNA maturation RNase YbeY [Flavobacteriaceae bacterium]